MDKRCQGSKKKARKAAFVSRELARRKRKDRYNDIHNATTLEEMALAMGVRLK